MSHLKAVVIYVHSMVGIENITLKTFRADMCAYLFLNNLLIAHIYPCRYLTYALKFMSM
jgi:hypothetical protein